MRLPENFWFILFCLVSLANKVISQLSTTGYIYEPVIGNYEEDVISYEKMTAYSECWWQVECGYVAKRKVDGKFVKLRIGAKLNTTKYSIIWAKRIEGKGNFYFFSVGWIFSILELHPQ